MSPPMSTSPAVVPELGRHFSIDDAKLPTPVAVVSGSMNGISTSVQVDKTHGELMKRSFAADAGKICLVRKRSSDDLQSRHHTPRAAVAAIPRCGSSYVRRKLSTAPIVSLSTSPQPMGRSPNNATAGQLSPSGGILPTSPSNDSYYLSSKLNTNSAATHIELDVTLTFLKNVLLGGVEVDFQLLIIVFMEVLVVQSSYGMISRGSVDSNEFTLIKTAHHRSRHDFLR
uniref:Uncharacterized protein n=1 Tax=Ascaris lumbricoides TaxID=6252 RepID=A0A0M3I186_ASCLU